MEKYIQSDSIEGETLPPIIPNPEDICYSEIKQTCLCGVSCNLCDSIFINRYNGRYPVVAKHFSDKLKIFLK